MKNTPENRHKCLDFMECFRYLGWPFHKDELDLSLIAYVDRLLETFRDIDMEVRPGDGAMGRDQKEIINDIDWITQKVLDAADRFPTIKLIREIYSARLMPYDEVRAHGWHNHPGEGIRLEQEEREIRSRVKELSEEEAAKVWQQWWKWRREQGVDDVDYHRPDTPEIPA